MRMLFGINKGCFLTTPNKVFVATWHSHKRLQISQTRTNLQKWFINRALFQVTQSFLATRNKAHRSVALD